ncbi:hypothetical protein CGT68_17810 [Vibrio cholerae]|nr:hypothetical protein CGT68_17810 [Vibrio cholerae]PAS40344.1 hypothetical protein CGT69_14790 [Vibrio cholerae]
MNSFYFVASNSRPLVDQVEYLLNQPNEKFMVKLGNLFEFQKAEFLYMCFTNGFVLDDKQSSIHTINLTLTK